MMALPVAAGRLDLYERATPSPDYLSYVRQHGLNMARVGYFAGTCAVLPIDILDGHRFDLAAEDSEASLGFICECLATDGETVIDLVAWPVNHPERVLTMFGKAGLLGAWEATSPGTYFMGGSLTMHRTPLDWLKADCRGAAVVVPHIAARLLIDLPGPIAARDLAHGRYLKALAKSVIRDDQILVPANSRRAA